MPGQTRVAIQGDRFTINGEPTYPGRVWRGHRIEGLLLNARLVQGVFDDLNPQTRHHWDYPDGPWDAERNTDAFVAAMPLWRTHGLLAFDLSLQGGSPMGYSASQPWHNSAFAADGSLRPAYMARLARILDRADELGMVVMLCLFYFGQDQRLDGDRAVLAAADHVVDWLADRGDTNVILELANEIDSGAYDQPLLTPDRAADLLAQLAGRGRWPVGVSYCGGQIPSEAIIEASDVVLLHGNGVGEGVVAGEPYAGRGDPAGIGRMVDTVRGLGAYRGQPIVFNEDDHYDFDQPANNFTAAIAAGASWGYFDWRLPGEGFPAGFQSVPTDWSIRHPRKQAFFDLLAEITGAQTAG